MKPLFLLILISTIVWSCKPINILVEPKAIVNQSINNLDSVFQYHDSYQYRIRKDDKISISVWGQDELSVGSSYGIYNSNEVYGKWLMVDAMGNIEVPKLGSLKVLNFTIIALKDTLSKSFGKWISKPIVDVKILNREISVLGEVRNPQVFTVDKENNTLLELITRSGGLEFYANARQIKVLRQDGTDVKIATIDMSKSGNVLKKNIQLLPGDIVIVPSKNNKEFDKRVSTIIPFTTVVSAAAILLSIL